MFFSHFAGRIFYTIINCNLERIGFVSLLILPPLWQVVLIYYEACGVVEI